MTFTCNVCGTLCEGALSREGENCAQCGSTVRIRALIALMSREIFGVVMRLDEFPVLKEIRGIGMSDAPGLAERLAEKFDYTNTFYHQAPRLDVTNVEPGDLGRFDFILSSEVMEHVPPPVERAFASLYSMLKPDAVLLLTTPYNIGGKTAEHFSELHEYTLAAPGGRTILVNRRRDGSVEVFEDLVFHGGHGSTLEMRAFTEPCLREVLTGAGFDEVSFAAENFPEFGIEHAESWSLPVAARKGRFRAPPGELALQYREAMRLAARKIRDLEKLRADYEQHSAHHDFAHAKWVAETDRMIAWVKQVEADWAARTQWGLNVEKDLKQAVADFEQAKKSETEAWEAAESLGKQLKEVQARLDALLRSRIVRWIEGR